MAPAEKVDKLERLMNLVAVLLDTMRPLSADELRELVGGYPEGGPTFHRAFERDKEDLREMGVPLVVQPLPGVDPPRDGYRILRDEYYLPDPGLEADELAALHLAVSTVQVGPTDDEALWKLGGVIGADGLGASPGGGGPVASQPTDARLLLLFGAVSERRRVRLTHGDVERLVDPYRLDFRRGRWYVTGLDHEREDLRSYRLDRIEGDVTTEGPGKAFERPDDVQSGAERQPWELGDDEPVEARVLVDADQAGYAVHLTGEAAVAERHDDGSVELALPVSNPTAFRSFVLTFLEHAEVLSPDELRDDLVTWLEHL
ncbi:MAG: WYL domain-containing protein [Acidimicrobiales bacterium]